MACSGALAAAVGLAAPATLPTSPAGSSACGCWEGRGAPLQGICLPTCPQTEWGVFCQSYPLCQSQACVCVCVWGFPLQRTVVHNNTQCLPRLSWRQLPSRAVLLDNMDQPDEQQPQLSPKSYKPSSDADINRAGVVPFLVTVQFINLSAQNPRSGLFLAGLHSDLEEDPWMTPVASLNLAWWWHPVCLSLSPFFLACRAALLAKIWHLPGEVLRNPSLRFQIHDQEPKSTWLESGPAQDSSPPASGGPKGAL